MLRPEHFSIYYRCIESKWEYWETQLPSSEKGRTLAFHCCDKIPEINNLKGRKIYFDSQFQRFPSSFLALLHLVLWRGGILWQGAQSRANCSPHNSWEAKRETGRGRAPIPL
jgi:hypothetical protein